ncbi:MAG: helix-turn-helix transcriptional regulator [Clostridia bacterium]|nr:helix-turn-helix transcriptional regulator [Clostridia bacterium]
MKYAELFPCLLSAVKFRSTHESPNSEKVKNQYYYRVMAFIDGKATVSTDEFNLVLKRGDVLFLTPNFPYRILNTHGEFEVLNIYFDFSRKSDFLPRASINTVLQSNFDSNRIKNLFHFEDAPPLNSSKVIANNKNIIDYSLKIAALSDNGAEMRLKRHLLSCILEEIIISEQRNNSPIKADEIINYIKENAEKKITADELSEIFHYHKNHINRIVKVKTGYTLKAFILRCKADLARGLLEETDMTTTEIAGYLNFFDASHLIKTMKRF